MENLLAFGIGIATCLVIGGAIYCIIVFRQLDNLTEEIEDDLEDLTANFNKFKREYTDKLDDIITKINDVKTFDSKFEELLDDLDERFEVIEDQLNQLQIKE